MKGTGIAVRTSTAEGRIVHRFGAMRCLSNLLIKIAY
jgi:hypothetical protein